MTFHIFQRKKVPRTHDTIASPKRNSKIIPNNSKKVPLVLFYQFPAIQQNEDAKTLLPTEQGFCQSSESPDNLECYYCPKE